MIVLDIVSVKRARGAHGARAQFFGQAQRLLPHFSDAM
jgi:hypothetical protein